MSAHDPGMVSLAIPGVVFDYIEATYPQYPMTTRSVARRGRGTTVHVSMVMHDAERLQEAMERSYDHMYISAGTSEQVRVAYAVARYAERLANELRQGAVVK